MMVQIDCVVNRILKNNIYRKSEKMMNKNTLLNFADDYAVEGSVNGELITEIMNVCDADNILSYGEFEENELKLIRKIKDDFGKCNENNISNIVEGFVDKNLLDVYKLKLSDLRNKIKTNSFKKYYIENLKRHNIANCNIKNSVKSGKFLQDLIKEGYSLEKEYNESVVQLNKIQLNNFENYEKMLQEYCEKKRVANSIKDITDKYSLDLLKVYLTRKIVYLIFHNFDVEKIPQIIKVLANSERFKTNYELVFDRVLESLRCGNK